ncbi:MAG: HaeII family restriction endonuclease [Planctomycetes bacterium]|nr:HaeII family restriction endonuclease [Planctomycetota bacterium]
MREAIEQCDSPDPKKFDLAIFLAHFTGKSTITRLAGKVYECVAFSILHHLLQDVRLRVSLKFDSINRNHDAVPAKFLRDLLGATEHGPPDPFKGELYRAGVANAADRGIDIFSNFGPIVQVKHQHLTASLALTQA